MPGGAMTRGDKKLLKKFNGVVINFILKEKKLEKPFNFAKLVN